MAHEIYDEIKLKDGRSGTIVDKMGPDYVVEVGETPAEYDSILVKPEEIEE